MTDPASTALCPKCGDTWGPLDLMGQHSKCGYPNECAYGSLVSPIPEPPRPPWAQGAVPNARFYAEAELFVAGVLSTMPPFDKYSPQEALPFARRAIEALERWEPTDA